MDGDLGAEGATLFTSSVSNILGLIVSPRGMHVCTAKWICNAVECG